MKLSKLSLPNGVHIAGETRRILKDEAWDISVVPEGVIVRPKSGGVATWIPSVHAESGDVLEESLAPVVSIAPKRSR